MYFGEESVLASKSVTCRVTVSSNKAILLGFSRDSLELYFDSLRREQWLSNNVLVRFPHEAEIRQDTIVDWKVNSIRERALLDGLKGSYSNAGERDAYLEWSFRHRQSKLKPLYKAIIATQRLNKPSPIKKIKLTVTPPPPKLSQISVTPNLDIPIDHDTEEETTGDVPAESNEPSQARDKRPLSAVGRFITG